MLMGDAGSRALGFYIAVIALKSTHPFIYILLAAVMIVDGGIGLVKIALKRFLKISILKRREHRCMIMCVRILAGRIRRLLCAS